MQSIYITYYTPCNKATVISDIAAYMPSNTLAGVVYIAPCPYIGQIMQEIGSKFILDLLITLTTDSTADTVTTGLGTFSDSCFTDANTIPWSIRAFWRGMASFQKQHHMLFSATRPQDPSKLFELGANGLPVLLLSGTSDKLVMAPAIKSAVQRLFKNSEIHLLPGAGHTPHYENKEVVMSYISSFVRRHTDKVRHMSFIYQYIILTIRISQYLLTALLQPTKGKRGRLLA